MTIIPQLSTESRIPTVPFSAPQDVGQEAYSTFSEAAGTPCASVQVVLPRHIPAATGKLQKTTQKKHHSSLDSLLPTQNSSWELRANSVAI